MRRDPVVLALLAVFVLGCAAWGARDVVHLDAVPLVLALEHQDLRLHQPQPPGYVLHLWIAEIAHAFAVPPFASLRLATLALLVGAALSLQRLTTLVADRRTARLAVLLFLACPLVVFQGMTTGPYAGEAFAATSTAYFLVRAWQRQQRALRFESYWLGLMGGLRPSTLVTTLPLLIWTGRRLALSRRSWAMVLLAALLGTVCWLVPQADIAGGVDDYVPIVWALAKPALQHGAFWGGPAALMHQIGLLVATLFWGLGGVRVLTTLGGMLEQRRRHAPMRIAPAPPAPDARGVAPVPASAVTGASEPSAPAHAWRLPPAFFAAWILPPIFFVLLCGMPGTGYALAFAPPLCLWLALGLTRHVGHPTLAPNRACRPLLLGAIALDVALFLFVSTPATRAPRSGMLGRLDPLLSQTDFFFDRTRTPEFKPLSDALQRLGPLAPSTLVLGGPMTRAACILAPARHVVQFDALRPVPFLHYQERRPSIPPDPYIVPPEVAWLLLEGSPAQIVRSAAILPDRAAADSLARRAKVALAGDFHLLPLGDGALDVWFVPTAGGAQRLHLWRDAPPNDPRLYERADAAALAWRQLPAGFTAR